MRNTAGNVAPELPADARVIGSRGSCVSGRLPQHMKSPAGRPTKPIPAGWADKRAGGCDYLPALDVISEGTGRPCSDSLPQHSFPRQKGEMWILCPSVPRPFCRNVAPQLARREGTGGAWASLCNKGIAGRLNKERKLLPVGLARTPHVAPCALCATWLCPVLTSSGKTQDWALCH